MGEEEVRYYKMNPCSWEPIECNKASWQTWYYANIGGKRVDRYTVDKTLSYTTTFCGVVLVEDADLDKPPYYVITEDTWTNERVVKTRIVRRFWAKSLLYAMKYHNEEVAKILNTPQVKRKRKITI